MGASHGISGPSLVDMFKNPSWQRIGAIIVGLISLSATLLCSTVHYCKLRSAGSKITKAAPLNQLQAERLTRLQVIQRQRLLMAIVAMIPIFGIGYFIPIVLPRGKLLCELIRHVAESTALEAFLLVLIDFMGSEAEANALLAMHPKMRFFAVPPFGCCFRFCPCLPIPPCAPSRWSSEIMSFALFCGWQFKIVVVLAAIMVLFTQLNMMTLDREDRHSDQAREIAHSSMIRSIAMFEVIERISMLVCMYSLMILYHATQKILHHLNSSKMFWIIKGPLLVAMLQEQVLVLLVRRELITGDQFFFASEYAYVLHCMLGGIWTCLVSTQLANAFPISLLTAEGQRAHMAEMECRLNSICGPSTECRSFESAA